MMGWDGMGILDATRFEEEGRVYLYLVGVNSGTAKQLISR